MLIGRSEPAFYGDAIPSMLQDFESGRKTVVVINGYVVTLGDAPGVTVQINAAITGLVDQIERGVLQPTRMNDLAAHTCQPIRGNRI